MLPKSEIGPESLLMGFWLVVAFGLGGMPDVYAQVVSSNQTQAQTHVDGNDVPHARTILRVMTFNILQGGEEAKNVGFDDAYFDGSRFDELAEVIRLARADVVGVQEDCSSTKLLQALEKVGIASVLSMLGFR